jgi:hypothetical protein
MVVVDDDDYDDDDDAAWRKQKKAVTVNSTCAKDWTVTMLKITVDFCVLFMFVLVFIKLSTFQFKYNVAIYTLIH